MPWIKEEDCIGCGVCVEECPADAIYIENEKARMNMDKCIRCGTCHDICPQEAVRHDSERIPLEIEENIEHTKKIIQNFEDKEKKKAFLGRTMKHFNMQKVVAEKTVEKIKILEEQL